MSQFIGESGLLSINSNPHEVEQLLNNLEGVLAKTPLDEMSAFHLQCAVIEVVNNCIQHAYLNQTGQPIQLAYWFNNDGVTIEVSDQGQAFTDPQEAPEIIPMNESGRGLQIIRAWVTGLSFERRDQWNVCTLEKKIQA